MNAKSRKQDLTELPEGPRACVINEAGSVTPCRALKATVAGSTFDTRKGIVSWSFIDFKTGKHSRTVYGCRSGGFENNGVMFGFCPFCGTKLTVESGTTASAEPRSLEMSKVRAA